MKQKKLMGVGTYMAPRLIGLVAEAGLSDTTVAYVMACSQLDDLASKRAFSNAGFRKVRGFDDVPNGRHLLIVRHHQEVQIA